VVKFTCRLDLLVGTAVLREVVCARSLSKLRSRHEQPLPKVLIKGNRRGYSGRARRPGLSWLLQNRRWCARHGNDWRGPRRCLRVGQTRPSRVALSEGVSQPLGALKRGCGAGCGLVSNNCSSRINHGQPVMGVEHGKMSKDSSLALLATEMGLLPRFPAITQTC
jgi:hypothetical protein